MLNYSNLNDVEFEKLCKDIMQKKLDVELKTFAKGRDGGIDLTNDVINKRIVIQVKHYVASSNSQLLSSLKKETPKIKRINPEQYYVCCSKALSPNNIKEIYSIFSDYMQSEKNIITINEIEEFLLDESNVEILKKHYKLWIDSTGILEDFLSNDLFVDCQELLSDINNDKDFFVQTSAYNKALEILNKNKVLFLTGDPGVGKTITSKMLVLYFATQGFRIRYTTDTSNLTQIKKSLSKNPKIKEIVLLDDCFGQAYFQMKESQSLELLSLIKYIHLSTNKLLVLNSRITIFKEAKEKQSNLVKSFNNKEYKVYYIDMSEIDNYEKALIFYNHLYRNKIEKRYFDEIKKEKRYMTIITHKNYNPRIIEFICRPEKYQKIRHENFYSFILEQLNNPKEVWKDEYENRLQKADRLLLSTIYSFSNLSTNYDLIKNSFEKTIINESNIDLTINQFESSLNRLMDSFVKIVDKNGSKRISMINPSVNDYMDRRFSENYIERKLLIEKCYYFKQFEHLLKPDEFDKIIIEKLKKHQIHSIIFENEYQKSATISHFVAKTQLLDLEYQKYIHMFLTHPKDVFIGLLLNQYQITAPKIIQSLMELEICQFYKIKEFLIKDDNLYSLLHSFFIDDLIIVIKAIDYLFKNNERDEYLSVVKSVVSEEIENYCSDIDADDYIWDVSGIIEDSYVYTEFGDYFDKETAVQNLEEKVDLQVREEIEDLIQQLPLDVGIDESFLEKIDIYIYGADDLIDSYESDNNSYYESNIKSTNEDTQIDYIFERDYYNSEANEYI